VGGDAFAMPRVCDMVYVPAGSFDMGSTERGGDQPVHTVTLDGFWIDQTEVTNAQYRRRVRAAVCRFPTMCGVGDPTYEDATKVIDDLFAICAVSFPG